MTRVLFVEDDPKYRSAIETLLTYTPGFSLAAGFERGAPAITWAAAGDWDLAVVDLDLPDMSGMDVIAAIKRSPAARPVVALTVFEEPRTIVQAICAGADGYILKRSSAAELLRQLKTAVDDGSPLSASVARTLLDTVRRTSDGAFVAANPARLDLTGREQEVLRKLVDGLAYKEVADTLGVSLDTVRTHVRAIYRKLHVHTVGAAVTRALRDGLV